MQMHFYTYLLIDTYVNIGEGELNLLLVGVDDALYHTQIWYVEFFTFFLQKIYYFYLITFLA